jgi:hypothetical protein
MTHMGRATQREGNDVKFRIGRFVIAPLVAAAMLLASGNVADAATATNPAKDRAAVEAHAVQVREQVTRALSTTGSARFTASDGVAHVLRVVAGTLQLDGATIGAQPAPANGTSPSVPASIWCNIKVAAAIAAIAVVGAAFIFWMISGLGPATIVVIAGLSLTVETWSTIAIILAAGGNLVPLMQTILC